MPSSSVSSRSLTRGTVIGPGAAARAAPPARAGGLVLRAGNRVAVRAGRRIAEQLDELLLDVGRDRVLPAVGFAVHLLPLEPDHVDEQALGEPVPAHDRGGEPAALVGEVQAAVAVQLDVAVRRSGGRRSPTRPRPTGRVARRAGRASARRLLPRWRGSTRGTPRSCRASRPSAHIGRRRSRGPVRRIRVDDGGPSQAEIPAAGR